MEKLKIEIKNNKRANMNKLDRIRVSGTNNNNKYLCFILKQSKTILTHKL